MNTINVTFNNVPALVAKAVDDAITETKENNVKTKQVAKPANRPKKSGRSVKERREDVRLRKQRDRDRLHPKPTDEQVADRWRIMQQEHNMLMLTRISREPVRGTADRDMLATDLLLDLVESRCNTPQAEAVGLLDSLDGADGRGRAHRIITNMALTRARSLITVRDREVSSDFTEVQRQAVTASVKGDGKWGKINYDSASTINREVGWQSGDPAGQERSSMEFIRGSEKISEMDVGSFMYKGKVYAGAIRIHKERSLVDMLNDSLRIGGLHDNGRVDRDDAYIMKTWQRGFFNNWPRINDKRSQSFMITVMERAERLQTTKVRQFAFCMLQMSQGAPMTDDRLVLMDIVRGEVRSLGTLAAACASSNTAQARKGKEATPEYTKVNVTTMCNMLGLECSSSNRTLLNKLLQRMAIEAGATAHYDTMAPYKSQHVRFPSTIPTLNASVNKDAFRLANDGNRCRCHDSLRFDETSTDWKVYECGSCRTMVRCTSLYANRSTDVLVQGLPMYMELRGAAYGDMHDFVCTLSGQRVFTGTYAHNVFVPFAKAEECFIQKHGAAAVDYYLVHGSWSFGQLRGA